MKNLVLLFVFCFCFTGGRKPKKVAVVPESNSTVSSIMTVPGNSPSVKSPKFKREDSFYAQNDEKDVVKIKSETNFPYQIIWSRNQPGQEEMQILLCRG